MRTVWDFFPTELIGASSVAG